jgi:hypothetical protein
MKLSDMKRPPRVGKIEQINPFELKPQERCPIQFETAAPQSADEVATIEAVLQRIYPKLKRDWRNDDDWAFSLATSEMADMRWAILLEQLGLSDDRLAYRQRIRRGIRALRRQMENGGDLCSVLESAVALGAMTCEARLHDELVRYTRIGKHVRDGGRKGAEQSHGSAPAEENYRQYRKSFERFRVLGFSKVAAYKAAAHEHRTSDRTVRKAVTGN